MKKFLHKIRPRFSFHYVAYTTLFSLVIFSVIQLVSATTPNPGHPWSELGDGTFVVSGPSISRTYTFPDANATILTTNATVTIAQGGTGQTSIAAGSVWGANSANTLSAVTSTSGTKILTNTDGTITWETAASGMIWPAGGAGIPNYSGSSSWGTSYTTNGSGTVLALATTPTFTTNITTPLVIGGTSTTDDLFLKTTSGVGATGADMHFLVGNNGATEAMTILNNGNVGIGINNPSTQLDISEDLTIRGDDLSFSNGRVFSFSNIMGYDTIEIGNVVGQSSIVKIYGFSSMITLDDTDVLIGSGEYSTGGLVITGGGELNVHSGYFNTESSVVNMFPNTAETVNAFPVADSIILGDTTGTTRIRNANTILDGFITVNSVEDSSFLGNLGIGTTSPTATLHLKAGTATANTAPLKFTSGTNLTNPEAGAMEWDGTNLFVTQTSGLTRKTIAYTSDLSSYIPYTGGTSDVNIGAHNLTVGSNLYLGASSKYFSALSTYGLQTNGWFQATNFAGNFYGGTYAAADNANTAKMFLTGTDANGYITFTTNAIERARINATGLGIGATPTAVLTLKAGTATANTAPLKFTSGTNLTNPEAGAMEWDGTNLFVTQTSGLTRKTIAYTSDITANSPINIFNSSNLFSDGLSGAGAGVTTTTDSNFFGENAGNTATDASRSNFLGDSSGYHATYANDSNFIGNTAGYGATNASYSNFLGSSAGYDATDATYSNFIGYSAGDSAVNASYSNLIGYKAGKWFTGNDIGSNNIIIGTNISLPNNTASSVNIGGVLFATGINSTTGGNPLISAISTGKFGVGVVTPTNILSLNGTAARTIWMERNTTAGTAGQGLTISSGGAIAGTNNLVGGDLNLKSGISTGTGDSAIRFFTATPGNTGSSDNTPTEKMTILGNGYIGINTTSPSTLFEIGSSDLGDGVAGPIITLGRNTNATNTGAGSVNFLSKAGTAGYIWQDNAGNMRINTSSPSNANDTAGTVVGTQTSTRETKQDINDYIDYDNALTMITDAPLHTFRYKKEVSGYGPDSPLSKERIGFIADEVDPMFMWNDSIDQVSVNGLLMASIKAMNLKLNDINNIEKENSFRDNLMAWLANAGNRIARIFTGEVCLTEPGQEAVCLNRSELQSLKILINSDTTSNTDTTDDTIEEIIETCSDGILNQDETEIDIGGVCNQDVTDTIIEDEITETINTTETIENMETTESTETSENVEPIIQEPNPVSEEQSLTSEPSSSN